MTQLAKLTSGEVKCLKLGPINFTNSINIAIIILTIDIVYCCFPNRVHPRNVGGKSPKEMQAEAKMEAKIQSLDQLLGVTYSIFLQA